MGAEGMTTFTYERRSLDGDDVRGGPGGPTA